MGIRLGKILKQGLRLTLVMMVICGLVYPFCLNVFAGTFFKNQSEGSLIEIDGKKVGALNVGQEFTEDYYLWSRPSSKHYNTYSEVGSKKIYSDGSEFQGVGSGSSNLAATNPELKKRIKSDISKLQDKDTGLKVKDIPEDLVTESGSGLDPEISPQAAEIQIRRISKASGLSEATIREIIKENTREKFFGVFGERGVNVLRCNVEIYKLMKG